MYEQKPVFHPVFGTDTGIAGLADVVEHYRRIFLPCEKEDCKHYRELSREDAARSAGLLLRHDGRRHSHGESWVEGPKTEGDKPERKGRREASLTAFADELVSLTGQLYEGMPFARVHAIVEEAAEAVDKSRPGGVRLFKPPVLLRYDAALMLAWHLGVEPAEVWLHSGAERGFRSLGFSGRRKTATPNELPLPFRELCAWQVEDILCVYRSLFEAVVSGKPVDEAMFARIETKRQKMGCGHRHCAVTC
ncbi:MULTISPECIES: hypothetical protein [Kitasatospora]|uniref:Uncharacterized protein n=1 Tax=Kitasatospora setae (strain ATCC 33774 / DSM 43861 / JCM 3304 / KCC A-0304 / NBRC 14216 / KM-6054) TaxID=452652 RepID=E4NHM7_KITSK|nr:MULTISPECIES: hypothetical protein [Kitasatospora]BAJ31007.1 hypothetical protein KSE_52320 [Kitasatospora setae KM-6054]